MQTKPKIGDVHFYQPIDTLVHLGAGCCSELDTYLAMQPQRLLLVEADPQLAVALQTRTASLPQVQVSCAAVAGHPGSATFYRYNLPGAGSLHVASGMLQLFPRLETVEKLQTETVSPVTLLQPLQLQAQQENHLIIDLPGEELPVLQALQQADQLHLFRHLMLLQCGREPLYEGGKPAARILHWLKEQGFDLLAEDDSENPDRPCWVLQRNTLQLRNRELMQQVEALRTKVEQLTRTNDEQTKLASERHAMPEQFKTELHQARQTANLATKLHMLSESDLQDLKQRYKEAITIQERQHNLLGELEERLRVAAHYFHRLREQRALLESQQTITPPKRRRATRRSGKKAKRS